MNELALFAGAGGGILGGQLLGWTTVGAVEIEKYPRECLMQRQRDGLLPLFPVWDDVCTFDGKPWRVLVDIVSGGFPCQDISSAGKGAGITGARSGLWKEMHRIICEVRPRYAFMENSPMLTSRGLGTVLGDLAESGYNAAWLVLGAADLGAPHRRDRIWILGKAASDTNGERREEQRWTWPAETAVAATRSYRWWSTEPAVGRVAPRMAHRVDRLKAIGNGQVPSVAATAFVKLYTLLNNEKNKISSH
jgi:DNA (cytosine-5)-methyltransferase 1